MLQLWADSRPSSVNYNRSVLNHYASVTVLKELEQCGSIFLLLLLVFTVADPYPHFIDYQDPYPHFIDYQDPQKTTNNYC